MDESRSEVASDLTAEAAAEPLIDHETDVEELADRRREGLATLAITVLAVGYAVYFFFDTLGHSWSIKVLPVGFLVSVLLLGAVEIFKAVRQTRSGISRSAVDAASVGASGDDQVRRLPEYWVAGAEIVFVLAATWLLIISIGTLPLGLTMALYGGVIFLIIERREANIIPVVSTAAVMGVVGYLIARFFPGVG